MFREMLLPASVERQSLCELEVDVVAADILNRREVTGQCCPSWLHFKFLSVSLSTDSINTFRANLKTHFFSVVTERLNCACVLVCESASGLCVCVGFCCCLGFFCAVNKQILAWKFLMCATSFSRSFVHWRFFLWIYWVLVFMWSVFKQIYFKELIQDHQQFVFLTFFLYQ